MTLSDITRQAVLDALAECDRLGQDEFLETHGFRPARSYHLSYKGRLYDSKAIVGVAHGFATGVALRAFEFSGGEATVARLLRGLGFEVVVDANDASTASHHADLFDDLRTLPVATYRGKRAPYQHVVLLWAISRARSGRPRIVRFSEVSDELKPLLAPFRLAATPPDPADPWAALKDSLWWEIDVPADYREGAFPSQLVRSIDPGAGLSANVYVYVRADRGFLQRTVHEITPLIGDHPAYEQLLATLGLTDVHEQKTVAATPAPPSGADTARRPVARLRATYADHLSGLSHRVGHEQLVSSERGAQPYVYLFDDTMGTLIDVRSSADRDTICLALGQLLDRSRRIAHNGIRLVVPEQPAVDLVDLLIENGISVAWPNDDGTFTTRSG